MLQRIGAALTLQALQAERARVETELQRLMDHEKVVLYPGFYGEHPFSPAEVWNDPFYQGEVLLEIASARQRLEVESRRLDDSIRALLDEAAQPLPPTPDAAPPALALSPSPDPLVDALRKAAKGYPATIARRDDGTGITYQDLLTMLEAGDEDAMKLRADIYNTVFGVVARHMARGGTQ
jgi:hypothetical protein